MRNSRAFRQSLFFSDEIVYSAREFIFKGTMSFEKKVSVEKIDGKKAKQISVRSLNEEAF
jgi:hypothetical protein